MMKSCLNTLTLASFLLNSVVVFADAPGTSIPATRCDKALVKQVWSDADTDLMEAHRLFFVEKQTKGWTPEQFCGWLRARHEKKTEAEYGCNPCGPLEPQTGVEKSFDEPFRQQIRRAARPPARETIVEEREERSGGGGGGGFMSSPFMGGLLGGALGGFLGAMLAGRMGQQQQQPYFPQPFGQYGMQGPPGALPMPGAPGMLPMPGGLGNRSPYALPMQGGSGVAPWAQPYLGGQQQFAGIGGGAGYGGYQYGGVGGGYGTSLQAPGVLPLAPQSSYGVGGSIPQNHWGLINVGR